MLDSERSAILRRDGRVAEGARLESVYTARYPGFESLSLRHFLLKSTCINSYGAVSQLPPSDDIGSVVLKVWL